MDAGLKHKILIVDDDPDTAKTIDRIPDQENVRYDIVDNEEADVLKRIETARPPFSIIIAGRRIKNMQGTQLLETAKKISPDTQRFLIAAHSDIETIMAAVNKGSIQRYISKPLNTDDFIDAVRQGLAQYEHSLENEKLLKLAKKQNAKLYQLNCELMDQTKSYDQEMQSLDGQIHELQKLIKSLNADDGPKILQKMIQALEGAVQNNDQKDPARLKAIYEDTVRRLYARFEDLAQRNGFEMPVPGKETAC